MNIMIPDIFKNFRKLKSEFINMNIWIPDILKKIPYCLYESKLMREKLETLKHFPRGSGVFLLFDTSSGLKQGISFISKHFSEKR